MWLNGESYARIAEEFGLSNVAYVYYATLALGLPRRELGFQLERLSKRKMEENEKRVTLEKRVIDFLLEKGGYCLLEEVTERFSAVTIQRLLFKRTIFKVSLSMKRSSGSEELGLI